LLVQVITQLDYRNVGDEGGIAWSFFSIAESFAMCVAFVTICACALTIDVILERAHQTIDVDFANRMMSSTDNGTQRLVRVLMSHARFHLHFIQNGDVDSGIDVPRYSTLTLNDEARRLSSSDADASKTEVIDT
jgi:hypothetical protein